MPFLILGVKKFLKVDKSSRGHAADVWKKWRTMEKKNMMVVTSKGIIKTPLVKWTVNT